MTVLEATKSENSSGVTRSGRLFVPHHSMNPDGSDRNTLRTRRAYPTRPLGNYQGMTDQVVLSLVPRGSSKHEWLER